MKNDPRNILPGDRVKVFDPRLFKDDVTTPLSFTMQAGTVVSRYGQKTVSYANVCYDDYGAKFGEPDVWLYPDLIDVLLDRDGKVSHGHFTTGAEIIGETP